MKVVHICLDNPYIDGWGYQENLLPEYMLCFGVENYVIASSNSFPSYLKEEDKKKIIAKGKEYEYNGVHIIRIPTWGVSSSFHVYCGLTKVLRKIRPDMIFEHNISPFTLPILCRYAQKHKCIMDVDNHADEINLGTRKLWNILYYRLACRISCQANLDAIHRFYGVTLGRCDFLKQYLCIQESKMDFLPIGADVRLASSLPSKYELREKYGFKGNDVIVISGGKMGVGKRTDILIKCVESIRHSNSQVHLLLFGKFEDEKTKTLAENSSAVKIEGWCNRIKTLELLKLADIACWPYHHTTLAEDAVSVNTPLILRKTRTTEHLISDNGWWLEDAEEVELSKILQKAISTFSEEKVLNSCERKKQEISYDSIAQRVLAAKLQIGQ